MKYTHLLLNQLAIEIKYAAFSSSGGNTEYHFMMNVTDPMLSFRQQLENTEEAWRYIRSEVLSTNASLVWCRYFLSDPVNQCEYVNFPENCAVSVVGQAPLNNSKLAVWLYCIDNVNIKQENGYVTASHSSYEHLFYTQLYHSPDKREYEQTQGIFSVLKELFQKERMTFFDNLIRTWIYVQGVDTHYKEMVVARRELFAEENLTEKTHYVASTGIEGRFIYPQVLVFMDAYAIKGIQSKQVKYLRALENLSPTNKYGVTFERGTEVQFGDRSHVFISGTASIDKDGEIVAPHDVLSQTKRTFENIKTLLKEAHSDFGDLAHLIIYLRDTADYPVVKQYVETYLPDVPKVFLSAPVCRPGWLIEMECIAVKENQNTDYPIF